MWRWVCKQSDEVIEGKGVSYALCDPLARTGKKREPDHAIIPHVIVQVQTTVALIPDSQQPGIRLLGCTMLASKWPGFLLD